MGEINVIQNYINGVFVETSEYIECTNPATGKVEWRVPNSTENDVSAAISAAQAAFSKWSALSVHERCQLLFKIADAIETKTKTLARLESMDQGKPVWLAESMDIPRAVLNFRHFATAAQCDSDKAYVQSEEGVLTYTIHEPVGVAGLITPWNLPLYLLTFKIAPALAYGNTVVAKPSEVTPVTAFFLCKIFEEVGLPAGVVNMVFGHGSIAGECLVSHPDTRLISFTGSTTTGLHVMQSGAKTAKKFSLEMGGKNAAIVFEDVALDTVVSNLIKASFLNQGEICLCSSRIYVQQGIYSKFLEAFVDQAKKLKVGDPQENDTYLGPLVSEQHLRKVQQYVKVAKKDGGTILCGGNDVEIDLKPENRNGYYFPPTVIVDLDEDSVCVKEEIFGPVVTIRPFKDETEAISLANDVAYGLCATVWTQNVNRLHRLAHKLKVGTVWANCWMLRNLHAPFGGTKLSGIGREGTVDSREFYTEKKAVCIKLDSKTM